MTLTIDSRIIADARIQGVTLRPIIGAYELLFGLYITIHPDKDESRHAEIIGARVRMMSGGSGTHEMGFARPQSPFEIVTRAAPSAMTPMLILPLQPGQLAALENLRGTGDLDFELQVVGAGMTHNGEQQVQDTWRMTVPRSDWIKKLRDAKARDILLLEIPLPLDKTSETWTDVENGLRRAEEYFRNGDYHACVGICRTVIQELGHQIFKEERWAGPLLSRLASDRDGMTKREREAALWAALRHYAHQAHHGSSEGGLSTYSRAEAQLALTLTASFVSNARSA